MENKNLIFKKFVSALKNNTESNNDEYKYIGTGNPNSDILIIGKEAAISLESQQFKTEITDNINFWNNLKDYNSENITKGKFDFYSPLYPYKGQILKKNNGKNNGTSTTWMNYQKTINYVFDCCKNKEINFHEKAFITEINSTSSKKTSEASTDSIPFRKKHVLRSEYFQSFPVVIISGVGYFERSHELNEIEELFNVSFAEMRFANKEKNTQPYWIYWNKEKTKIVINSYQLSIGIANVLLLEIAKEIKDSKLLEKL